ncbi:hypothetical protein EDB85DRAFT_1889607 [Lactarius pseudohatsudake]|nr:hypothetical protein EDB85DRAFT_1889607 [Lactarius pseudohatsudake]
MVACILQEQLAPILETIREHSRLLDWHSALLNHSTVMNRYNVGKLDDLRDLQTNVNYKLQFHIDPEDRKRPTYRGPQPTSAPQSTAIAASTGSSPQKDAFLSRSSHLLRAPREVARTRLSVPRLQRARLMLQHVSSRQPLDLLQATLHRRQLP